MGGITSNRTDRRLSNDAGIFRVNLRLPPDLYHQLVISADTSYRSLNSEIILRLQRSLEQSKELKKHRLKVIINENVLKRQGKWQGNDPIFIHRSQITPGVEVMNFGRLDHGSIWILKASFAVITFAGAISNK